MTKRLFVGTLLPAEDAQLLAGIKNELDPLFSQWWHCKLRWVKPEKLHTTWLFLGDCEAAAEEAVKESLEALLSSLKTCELQYDEMQFFPGKQKPSAMVLLPRLIPEQVMETAMLIRGAIGKFCQKKEERPFRPHLTLFRFPREQHGHYALQSDVELGRYLPLKQKFSNLSLVESHAGNAQEEYRVIADYRLPIE